MGIYIKLEERGLDCFKPGQMIVLGFYDLMNENEIKLVEKEKQSEVKIARIPAMIVQKKFQSEYDIPVYDVIYYNRTRCGELLGYNVITGIPIWRYLSGDIVEEGTPPQWFIDSFNVKLDNEFESVIERYNILKSDIHYIVKKDDEDYRYYPFRKSNSILKEVLKNINT